MRTIVTAALGVVLAACAAEPSGASAPAPEGKAEAVQAASATPERRTFRDWIASCDNGGACFAFAGTSEGPTGWIRVAMEAGPEARPRVSANFWGSGEAEEQSPLTLRIDGRSWALGRPENRSSAPHGEIAAAQAGEVVAALAAARAISLGNGVEEVAVNPSGASAAFLWIDERQGRLETTTALARRGDRPASAVPAAPALPLVLAAPAVAQTGFERPATLPENASFELPLPAPLAALPEVKQCRDNLDWNPEIFKAVIGWRLSKPAELWAVPCYAGAYNLITRMFVTGPGGTSPHPAELAIPHALRDGPPDEQVERPPNELTNPYYDPATRVLSHFPRARGIGDCGVIQSWTWTGEAFVLSDEKSMVECWGVPSSLWPTNWRTRAE